MPDVIIPGPAGRLEGRYSPSDDETAPVALILHAHPLGGGHMENPIVEMMYDMFRKRGFATLRFNFRGVGRSQGSYDQGLGELSDAATVLDWVQGYNQGARYCWVAGHSFGAWIGMQLLMRRPEIAGFVSVAPPTNMYDFTFLAPCPASGIIVHGGQDKIVPPDDVERVMSKVRVQKGIDIHREIEPEANHLFSNHLEQLEKRIADYIDARLPEVEKERAEKAERTGRR